MIQPDEIGKIIQTYEKHGWILRRVLLTARLRRSLGSNIVNLFSNVEIIESDIEAAWFSRPWHSGTIAWEIRHFSETPYALLEYADENAEDFEDKLREAEARLIKGVAAKQWRDSTFRTDH